MTQRAVVKTVAVLCLTASLTACNQDSAAASAKGSKNDAPTDAAPHGKAHGPEAPPIRYVTRGYAKLPEYVDYLKLRVEMCQMALQLPITELPIPSLEYLRGLEIEETEHLHDGPLFARYHTWTTIEPDPKASCQLKLLRTYSASAGKSCSYRFFGGTSPGRHKLIDPLNPAAPESGVLEEKREEPSACSPLVKRSSDVLGLPTEMTAAGVPCVQNRHIESRMKEKYGLPQRQTEGRGPQICVHPNWHPYPYSDQAGNTRAVYLKTTLSGLEEQWARQPETYGSISDTYVYEEGKPIPAHRFSRAAVESFVKQPVWLPLSANK